MWQSFFGGKLGDLSVYSSFQFDTAQLVWTEMFDLVFFFMWQVTDEEKAEVMRTLDALDARRVSLFRTISGCFKAGDNAAGDTLSVCEWRPAIGAVPL